MPEATLLYAVAAAVTAGLVAWVVFSLRKYREPWARPPLAAGVVVPAASVAPPLPPPVSPLDAPPGGDADSTSRATPLALSEGKARAAREAQAAKKDEP